jgi:ATP-dependent Clp protease ATP-binding subunit ClpA
VHGQCLMPLHNSNPNSYTNSSSTSDEASNKENYHPKFKELNAENLKILCNALERKVPWQKVIVPEIASAILTCRSGMKRKNDYCRVPYGIREDTWLLFGGRDNEGKENIIREMANLIFGSQNCFVSLRLGAFSPTTQCISPDNMKNKRSRLESEHDYLEQVFHALHENPHRVIFIKDVDQLDYNSKMCLKRAIQDGVLRNVNNEQTSFHDSILVLSCDVFNSKARACSPQNKRKVNHEEKESASEKEASSGSGLDLNLCVDDNSEEYCFDDVGLLEAVDQVFCFNLQEGL